MTYRADIDGLRSVAVLLVVLFHFGIGYFPGGYIGVDVFFVLSGFLISSLIFKDLDAKRFSFSTFYYRRIKRLAPVYFVVMASSCVAAYSIMLPSDFKEFGQSLFASAIYLSNILFYLESGYFDSASHIKPLLHTWSLSVEEQFYIVFPVLALFLFRFGRNVLVVTICFLTLTSLVFAQLYLGKDQSAVFFLYPFRAWEMFLGSILALNVIPKPKRALSANLLSIIGLLVILVTSVVYDESTPFPGTSALFPCLATMALILSGSCGGIVNRALANPVPVFIGKLSYSMYLWHWPVYVFYNYYFQRTPDGVEPYLLLVLTFLLSYLSWRFVETPFRSNRIKSVSKPLFMFISTFLFTMLCLGFGMWIHTSDGAQSRLNEVERDFAKAAVLFEQTGKCQSYENSKLPGIRHCAIGDPYSAEKISVVWGDSHGGAYVAPFRVGVDNSEHILIAWAGGCPPVVGIHKQENFSNEAEDRACEEHATRVLAFIRENAARIKAVVIAGRWSYYLNGGGVGRDVSNQIQVRASEDDTFVSIEQQRVIFAGKLEYTLRELGGLGPALFFIEQPPEIENFHARTLAVKLKTGQQQLDEIEQGIAKTPRENVVARQVIALNLAEQLASEGVLTVLRTHERLCDERECSALLNGQPVYFDNNHLTASAKELVAPMFLPAFQKIKGNTE